MSASRPLIRHSGSVGSESINALLSPPLSPSEMKRHIYSITPLLNPETFDTAPFSESFLGFLDDEDEQEQAKDDSASPTETGLATPADTVYPSPDPEPTKPRPCSVAVSVRGDASYYVENLTDIRDVDSDWDDDEIEEVMVISAKHKSKRPRSSMVGLTTSTTIASDTGDTSNDNTILPSATSSSTFPSSTETTPTLTPSTSTNDQVPHLTRTHKFPLPPSVCRELACYKLLSEASATGQVQFLQTMESCWEDGRGLNMVFEKPEYGNLLECVNGMEADTAAVERWQMKIWACEIAQGIASLHKLGVVHRSLRPSHIFINSEGHAVIGGFERSVILTQQQLEAKSAKSRSAWRNSVISIVDNGRSPEDESEREWEESPEMLLGWEHGVEVDWWAYGVVLGRLASGQHPLVGKGEQLDSEVMRQRITRGHLRSNALADIEPGLKDLIQKCLERNPAKRINYEGIKNHPFFADLDWDYVVLEGQSASEPAQTPLLSGTPCSRVTLASPFDTTQRPVSFRDSIHRQQRDSQISYYATPATHTNTDTDSTLDAFSVRSENSPRVRHMVDSPPRSSRPNSYSLSHSPDADHAETATLGFAQRLSLLALERPVSIAISRSPSYVNPPIPEEEGDEDGGEEHDNSTGTVQAISTLRAISQGYGYSNRSSFASSSNPNYYRNDDQRLSFAPPSLPGIHQSRFRASSVSSLVSNDGDGEDAGDVSYRSLRHSNSTNTTFGREVDARPSHPSPHSPISPSSVRDGSMNARYGSSMAKMIESTEWDRRISSTYSLYTGDRDPYVHESEPGEIIGARTSRSRTGRGTESEELGVDEFGVWIDDEEEHAAYPAADEDSFKLEGEVPGEDVMSITGALALPIPILVDSARVGAQADRYAFDEDNTITPRNANRMKVQIAQEQDKELYAMSRTGTMSRLREKLKKKRRETMVILASESESEDVDRTGAGGWKRARASSGSVSGADSGEDGVRRISGSVLKPRSASVPLGRPGTSNALPHSGSGNHSDISLPEIAWHGHDVQAPPPTPPSARSRHARFAVDDDEDEATPKIGYYYRNHKRRSSHHRPQLTTRASSGTLDSLRSRFASPGSPDPEAYLVEKRQDERIRADETFRWSALSLEAPAVNEEGLASGSRDGAGGNARVTWSIYGRASKDSNLGGRGQGPVNADSSIRIEAGHTGGGGNGGGVVKKILKKISNRGDSTSRISLDATAQNSHGGSKVSAATFSGTGPGARPSLRTRLSGSLRSSASSATISAAHGSNPGAVSGSVSGPGTSSGPRPDNEVDQSRREGWVRSSAFVASLGSLGMGAGVRRMGRGIGYNASHRRSGAGIGARGSGVGGDFSNDNGEEDEAMGVPGCYSGLWRRENGFGAGAGFGPSVVVGGVGGTEVRVSREVKVEEEEEEEEEVLDVGVAIAAGCD